jgi:hypothetical protein
MANATNDNVTRRDKLPPNINEPPDPKKGAADGDKYYAHVDRAGNSTIISTVPGKELMMWQHRAGQFLAFMPNGGIQMRANMGMHTFVMGQSHHYVSGLENRTIEGDKGERVKGDSYVTHEKNSTQITKGDSVISSKNEAKVVAEQSDSVVGSATIKAKNGYNLQVTEGAMSQSAAKGVNLASKEGSVAITGKQTVTMEGGESVAVTASNDFHLKVGSFEIYIDGSGVYINSGKAKVAEAVYKSPTSTAATNEA